MPQVPLRESAGRAILHPLSHTSPFHLSLLRACSGTGR